MRITIIFSGLFSVLARVEREDLDLADGTTIEKLSSLLGKKYQNLPLETGKTYFMINSQVCMPCHVLTEGDQVRVFQLLGGG